MPTRVCREARSGRRCRESSSRRATSARWSASARPPSVAPAARTFSTVETNISDPVWTGGAGEVGGLTNRHGEEDHRMRAGRRWCCETPPAMKAPGSPRTPVPRANSTRAGSASLVAESIRSEDGGSKNRPHHHGARSTPLGAPLRGEPGGGRFGIAQIDVEVAAMRRGRHHVRGRGGDRSHDAGHQVDPHRRDVARPMAFGTSSVNAPGRHMR